MSVRGRKVLNEVLGNGVPQQLWDWKLLEKSVGLMSRSFGAFSSGTRIAKVLDEGILLSMEARLELCKQKNSVNL